MKIVSVAAEFAPIAKAGGLGEVILGLSRELTRLSEDVEVIIPKYQFIPNSSLPHLKKEFEFVASENGLAISNTLWSAVVEGIRLLLLEPHHPAHYFNRDRIYNFPDDHARFLYFSKAVYEYLKLQKKTIDILHLHDWHSSALALMAKAPLVKKIALTLHNAEYQGKCSPQEFAAIGLSHAHQNLLQIGVEFSNAIIPVSPTYAKEILSSEFGFGLKDTYQANRHKIHGILNGIDTKIWNPETDPHLPIHYSEGQSIQSIRQAKQAVKKKIVQERSLPSSFAKKPWFGAITRIVRSKGSNLLASCIPHIESIGGNFILLGTTSDETTLHQFEALKKNPNSFIELSYNDSLAHKLYAALDFLLIPSYTEPCGLTQMIGMRYGTIPIARSTGGICDTIFDWESSQNPFNKRNGFLFNAFDAPSFHQAIDRASALYHKDPSSFDTLLRHGMATDFSWTAPAAAYRKLFQQLK